MEFREHEEYRRMKCMRYDKEKDRFEDTFSWNLRVLLIAQ